MQLNITS